MTKHFTVRLVSVLMALWFAAHLGVAVAKLVPIGLTELVQDSTIIALGRSVAGAPGAPAVVWFEPSDVLKGKSFAKGQRIALCNDPKDTESFDLTNVREQYVAFLRRAGNCYAPVRGTSSIVIVEDGNASTGRILDQPEMQRLTELFQKIRSLAEAHSR